MARGIAPDVNNPYPGPPKGTGGNNNGGGNGGGGGKKTNGFLTFDAFMPGQLGSLATDLATFGGGVGDWKDYLRETTAPTMVPVTAGARNRFGNRGGGGGGNNGGNGGGNGPKDDRQSDNPGGFDPSRPRNRSAMPMQSGFLNVGPPGQQMAPTAGLLGRPRQPVAQGNLPPEIQMMMSSQRR